VVQRVVPTSDEDIQPVFAPRGHTRARCEKPAQREVADPRSTSKGPLPKLVIGAADEDVDPLGPPRYGSGTARDGRTKIIRRVPGIALVHLVHQGLAGPWAKTSSLSTPQEATLGAEVYGPPRSSQSLHSGPVGAGLGDGVAVLVLVGDGLGATNGVAAGAGGRSMTKRPMLAVKSTRLPKMAGNHHRRRALILRGNTAAHYSQCRHFGVSGRESNHSR
jgi:hypothetical protein